MTRPTDVPAAASNRARYRVLPLGAGRIFTGAYDARANRFVTLAKGETAEADLVTARRLEKLGLAEIL
jgi:hypothetical protein